MSEIVQNETELLAAVSVGDFKAFGDLYEKYHRILYFFALNLSKNSYDAEELVQSVFVSIWETRQNIDPERPFNAYLFSITRHRFYNMLRKRITENCYIDYLLHQDHQADNNFEKQMEDNEINEIIQKLLQQVPNRRQEIFRMSRDENLSYKQIAEKLQISENTVDSQIRNVLNFLRKELPKYLKILLYI